jgi:signal peptidase I
LRRIVGLPGESLAIAENGAASINGHALPEPYVHVALNAPYSASWHLGAKQYFAMGDNRGDSCDSRDWGPLGSQYITGKVIRVY